MRPPMGHAIVMNANFFDFSTLVLAMLPKSSSILLADIFFFFLSSSLYLSLFLDSFILPSTIALSIWVPFLL